MTDTLLGETMGWATANIPYAGLGDLGKFDTNDGADSSADIGHYKPAGMPDETVGSTPKLSAITLTRGVRRQRDRALIDALYKANGKVGGCIIAVQWLDEDENPFGNPIVYRGRYSDFKPPKFDSNGGNNVAMMELGFELDYVVSA